MGYPQVNNSGLRKDQTFYQDEGPYPMIPFNKPSLEGREIDNILESVKSGVVSGDGPFIRKCEQTIEHLLGACKVLLTSSGTAALELSALLCGIQPGDEIIMPAFTFVSTANAFCLRGARPVFIDIRPDTLNLDETLIEPAITARTRAIVPVHYAGLACEMDTIMTVAQEHGLKVIEDAAQGFLSMYKGRHLGTLGDLGCFSFHETKTFTCGEGGAVVINHEENIARAEILLEKGTNRKSFLRGEGSKYTWLSLGSSFVPSDILAAFLYGQLEARDKIIAKRRAIFTNYENLLKPLADRGLIQPPHIPEHCTINYHLYYFIVQNLETRTQLIEYLQQKGICAVFHYVPLHRSPYAQSLGIQCDLPVTESVANRLVRLPFFNSLTINEQEYIVEQIYAFYKVPKHEQRKGIRISGSSKPRVSVADRD